MNISTKIFTIQKKQFFRPLWRSVLIIVSFFNMAGFALAQDNSVISPAQGALKDDALQKEFRQRTVNKFQEYYDKHSSKLSAGAKHIWEAEKAELMDNKEEADRLFKEGLKKFPGHFDMHQTYFLFLLKSERLKEADALCVQILEKFKKVHRHKESLPMFNIYHKWLSQINAVQNEDERKELIARMNMEVMELTIDTFNAIGEELQKLGP